MSEPAPPIKSSIFAKWSKPETLASGADLFSRSSHIYADTAAQAERSRKKKQARKERERERQAASEERRTKRQCVSLNDDDSSGSSSEKSSIESDEEKPQKGQDDMKKTQKGQDDMKKTPPARFASPAQPVISPKSLLKRYEAKVAAHHQEEKQKQKQNLDSCAIIDLETGASSDDPENDLEIVGLKPPSDSKDEEQAESDEEFPELARQARERERKKRLEEDLLKNTPEPTPPSLMSDNPISNSQNGFQLSPPPPPPDPVLQILITSSIPNTTQLLVNRKLSQRLKEVRQAWVQRQGFSQGFGDSVFLTWRGKRLFDSTTCRSLGISCDTHGNIKSKDDILDMDEKLHMEVMTPDILEAYKKAKKHEAQPQEATEDEVPVKEKESGIRIVMKSKHYTDFKVIVQKTTPIAKLVSAFKKQNRMGEVEVSLLFDGEELSHSDFVQNTELSDLDVIDVVLK